MFLANRHNADLRGREPERENTLEVLDDDADKALQRAVNCAVNDDRHRRGTVCRLIAEAEVMRKLEVQLNRSALPLSAERILNLQVDLRSVESAVALVDFKAAFTVLVGENLLESCLRAIPDFDVTHEVIRARGELSAVGHAESRIDLIRNRDDIRDLRFDLIFRNEGVVIVLTEFLDAEQTVHLTGLLFAVKHVILRITNRELFIRAVLPLEGEHRVRAVHRLRCHRVEIFTAVEHRTRLNLDGLLLTILFRGVFKHTRNLGIGCEPAGDARHHEHVVDVVCPVAGNQPELLIVDERRGNLSITVACLHLTAVL